jgi:hypothetical protein
MMWHYLFKQLLPPILVHRELTFWSSLIAEDVVNVLCITYWIQLSLGMLIVFEHIYNVTPSVYYYKMF